MPIMYSAAISMVALSLFSCASAFASPSKSSIAACQHQVRAREATTGAQVSTPKSGVICFGGAIDKISAKALIQAVKSVPQGQPLTIVVEGSNGGDLASGLDIADALAARDSTVIAHGICASSCANYLWLMADHRIIAEGGLIIFHGGASLALLPGVDKQIEAFAKKHPGISVKKVESKQRATMQGWIKRQDALLARAGVDSDFFGIFDHIGSPNILASEPKDCKARPNAKYVVFSIGYLESKGVEIEMNKGPSTASEVHTYLQRIAPKKAQEVCFWN